MPASSPALTSSSSVVEAALLRPAHLHPQHHLRPVLGVGAARAGVDRDERVAAVVGPGEEALLLEREEARLDVVQARLELGGELVVLRGELDERVEVLDVALDPAVDLEAARHARVLGRDLRGAAGVVPERPGRPSASRAPRRARRAKPGQR